MNNNESQTNVADKKPYEKPQVIYQQRLEAMAAICIGNNGKTPTSGFCTNPNTQFS